MPMRPGPVLPNPTAPPPASPGATPPKPKDMYGSGGGPKLADGSDKYSYATQYMMQGGRDGTGQGIDTSKLVPAAQENFKKIVAPDIEAQMALAGLGHSTALADSLARGGAQMMPDIVRAQLQAQIANQQNAMSAGTAALQSQTQRYLGDLQAKMGGINSLIQLGNQGNGQNSQAIQDLMATGGLQQGYGQSQLDSFFNDFLRRAGGAQFATGTPFGGAGSMIGSQTHGKG